MNAETPFITHCKSGGFRLVWASDWDQPYAVDKQMGRYASVQAAERACVAAYGVFPHFHGIGF